MSRSTTGQQLVTEVAGVRRELQALELRMRDIVAQLATLIEAVSDRG